MSEHWTKTPEGKARLSEAMKKFHTAKKAAAPKTKRKYTKKMKQVGVFTLTITGPDTQLVLTEILMGAYKVKIQVEK